MILDQTVLTYQGTWTNTFTQSAQDVVDAVSAKLTGAGLAIRSTSVNQPFSASAIVGVSQPFNVTLTIQVQNGVGFGSPDDVISIIRSNVYQVTGSFPQADTIPYQAAPGGSQVSTGQPGLPKPPCDKSKCGFADIFSSDPSNCCGLADWLAGLTSTTAWVLGIAVIGILAGVILVSGRRE